MSDYKITCCSTCDLTRAHLESLGTSYALYHYIMDGEVRPDDFFETVSAEEFYGAIDGGALPTTAQITPDELCALFDPILSSGSDILHIEFSSGLSGSWQSALVAREIMRAKYPERKIYAVDSLAASAGYGLLVDRAAELKRGGMGIDELYAWLEENKLRVRHWFFTSNLFHLTRGGRVSRSSATVGTLLHICPVMDVNSEGRLIVRRKVPGRRMAMREIYRIMCVEAEDGADYSGKVYLTSSMREEDARTLASYVESGFPKINGRPEINMIGPVIGSHTGPGVVALFYFSKDKRTS